MTAAPSPQSDAPAPPAVPLPFAARSVAALLFLLALFVFTWDTNVEWQGNDDYLHFCEAGFYARLELFPPSLTQAGLEQYARVTLRPFVHAPHNLMPAFAFGQFYRVADGLRVPFSVRFIHFPIALYSASCCAVFFLLLLRLGFGHSFALLGALLLIASPIFSMNSRGIATHFLAVLPCSQILVLFALQNLSDRRASKVWASLALLNAALSDLLFFLSLPAMLLAYALRNAGVGECLRSPRHTLRRAWQDGAPLRNKTLLLPLLLVFAWWGAWSVFALAAARLGGWTPVTPLYRLLSHTGHFGSMLFQRPAALHNYASLLGGEAFLYAFVLALAGYGLFVRRAVRSFAWWFAMLLGSGYSILWYILCRDDWGVRNYYQIYVLVSALLIVLYALRALAEAVPRTAPAIFALLCGVLLFSILGQLSYVWHLPLSLRCTAYLDWTHGANHPDTGTKAVGYLVRNIALNACKRDPNRTIRLSAKPLSTSLEVFSGLMFKGAWYEKQCGGRPTILTEEMDDRAKLVRREGRAPLSVFLNLRDDPASAPVSPGRSAQSRITVGDTVAASLLVALSEAGEGIRLEDCSLSEAERRYDKTYWRLSDFFPYP